MLHNPAKQGTFTVDERVDLLGRGAGGRCPTSAIEAVRAVLLVDVCREVGAQAIVKGLRGDTDFAYELPMALMNRHLTGVETVFLPGDPEFAHVSSSLVKEVAALGGDVEGLVPDAVLEALLARVARSRTAEPRSGPPRPTDPHLGAGATLR